MMAVCSASQVSGLEFFPLKVLTAAAALIRLKHVSGKKSLLLEDALVTENVLNSEQRAFSFSGRVY